MRIKDFKHKGLELYCVSGNTSGIDPSHGKKISQIITILKAATNMKDVFSFRSLECHKLKGKLKDHYSLSVSGAWRITFKVDDTDLHVLDYQQYH